MKSSMPILAALLIGAVVGTVMTRLLGSPSSDGTVFTRGGTVDGTAKHERCKPKTQPCDVMIEPVYLANKQKCKVKMARPIVMAHQGQIVNWKLVLSDGSTPATDFEFDEFQGVEIAGNQVNDDDSAPTGQDPVFINCSRSASSRQQFSCQSDSNVTQAKVLSYTVVLKHVSSGKTCIYDPIIVNRD